MRKTVIVVSVALAFIFGSLSPALVSAQKSKKTPSLYKRLGGKKGVETVIDDFINIVAADTRINKFFADTASDPKRLKKFKEHLYKQICEATGGRCKYKGEDMKTAHMGMGITEADFNALVEDLTKALDKNNVGEMEKKELLGALGPMKGEIVESPGGAMMMKEKSLYDRLGGKAAITAVVDEFIGIVVADTRINKFFADTGKDPKRVEKLKMNLINQICEASGGPCKYTGKDMKTAHEGMGIAEADFNALVEDLVKALDKFKVGKKEKDQLLGALGPMKGDIVEK